MEKWDIFTQTAPAYRGPAGTLLDVFLSLLDINIKYLIIFIIVKARCLGIFKSHNEKKMLLIITFSTFQLARNFALYTCSLLNDPTCGALHFQSQVLVPKWRLTCPCASHRTLASVAMCYARISGISGQVLYTKPRETSKNVSFNTLLSIS